MSAVLPFMGKQGQHDTTGVPEVQVVLLEQTEKGSKMTIQGNTVEVILAAAMIAITVVSMILCIWASYICPRKAGQ